MIGSGNWTLEPQKDHAARPGMDRLKRLFAQSGTRSLNTIAQMIDNMIVRAIVKITCVQMHKHIPRGTRPPDDGWRPDQPNDGQTVRIFWIFRIFSRFPRIMKKDACCTKCIFLYVELVPRIIQRCMLYQMHLSVRRTCTKNLGHNQDHATKAYGRYAYRHAPVESVPQDCFIM